MHKIYRALPCLLLCWVLGCHEGHIALFAPDDPQPLEVYPYRTEMFPVRDQKDLQRGIPVKDETELSRLLTDFLS